MPISRHGDGCSVIGCDYHNAVDDVLFSTDDSLYHHVGNSAFNHKDDNFLSYSWNDDWLSNHVSNSVFNQNDDDFLSHPSNDHSVPNTIRTDSSDEHFQFDGWGQGSVRITETDHSSVGARSLVLAIVFLAMLVAVFFIGFRKIEKQDDETNDNDNNSNSNENRSNSGREVPFGDAAVTGGAILINETNATIAASRGVAGKSAEIPLAQRVALYSDAFNRNQNQIILDETEIVPADSEQDCNQQQSDSDKRQHGCDEEDSYCSILRALENTQARRRSVPRETTSAIERKSYTLDSTTMSTNCSRIDMAANLKRNSENEMDETVIIYEDDSISVTESDSDSDSVVSRNDPPGGPGTIVHPRCRTVPAGDEDDGTIMVPKICVICFEEMKPGELIVWSETESCPHVYHKDCVVSFFAHKKQTAQQLGLNHNPCPTCRRSFVTICGKAV